MCFTLLKALGHEIGLSLLEESFISKAEELLNSKYGKKILLPIDLGVAESIDSSDRENVKLEDFKNNHIGVDIGPQTVSNFREILKKSNNIFWNGPMGVFENELFSEGTSSICNSLREAKEKGVKVLNHSSNGSLCISLYSFEPGT